MKRKISIAIIVLLSVLLMMGLSGCDSKDKDGVSEKKSEKPVLVGFCANDTNVQFVANLGKSVAENLKQYGIETQVVSAAMTSATQIAQIENFGTMKASVIIIIPVDPTSCADAIRNAQKNGSKVLVLNSDTGVYDSIMHSDRYAIGVETARLAAKWIDETFPDAKDETIEVAVFESRSNPEAAANSDGLHEITNLTSKAKIVQVLGGIETNALGQEATAAVLQSHPNLKAIVIMGSESGLGANAFFMSQNSMVKKISEFGVFGSDFHPELASLVKASTRDEAVYRGTVKFGGDDLPGDISALAKKMALGEDFPEEWVDPYLGIDRDNIDEYLK